MESTFSSPAEAALQREAGAAGLLTPLADLDRVYELQRVVGFVRGLACQRVRAGWGGRAAHGMGSPMEGAGVASLRREALTVGGWGLPEGFPRGGDLGGGEAVSHSTAYAYRWPCSSPTNCWEMLGLWLHDWRRPRGRKCSFWGTQPMAGVTWNFRTEPRDPGLVVFSPQDSGCP